ncbi:MAG: pilus assembly protein PilM [Alphaproteobacteria bacterium]|nr:pilus assembly protein PilM [Alphaproteobacteria bacterium]
MEQAIDMQHDAAEDLRVKSSVNNIAKNIAIVKPLVIIDIGATSITGLAITSEPFMIKAWAQVKSEGVFGENFPHFNQLGHAIQDLMGRLTTQLMQSIDEAVLCFSGAYLHLETLSFQKNLPPEGLNRQGIKQWLTSAYQEYQNDTISQTPDKNASPKNATLHVLLKEVYIDKKLREDFNQLPPHHYHKGRQISVTLNMVKMKQHIMHNLQELLTMVDVKIAKTIAAPYADFVALKEMMLLDTQVAICHIGAHRITVSYFDNDMLQYIRTAQLGSNDITKDVMEAFAIDWQQAEKLKCEQGFALVSEESMLVKDYRPSQYTKQIVNAKNMGADMSALLPRIITPRIEEIFDCSHKLLKDMPKSALIVLSGAGTQLPGIVSVARNYFKRRVLLAPYRLANILLDEHNQQMIDDTPIMREKHADVITGLGMAYFVRDGLNNDMQDFSGINIR